MATVARVSNVEEAITLAETWRKEGRYNWFRGQLQAWQPASTVERKIGTDQVKRQAHQELIGRFLSWAKQRPDLAYLGDEKNINALNAVLQHYGVPTCYIDFSTEPAVAGFFSADTPHVPSKPIESVIYCLDTDDLRDFYERYTWSIPAYQACELEIVSVDVSNLWRLQAQRGNFIYANHSWYHIYDMDKIVFPWTGYPAYPTVEEIYPKHKSSLEQALDEFFFLERRRTGFESLKLILDSVSCDRVASIEYESPADFYEREAFTQPLSMDDSWNDAFSGEWLNTKSESFSQVSGKVCRLQVRQNPGSAHVRTQIQLGLEYALRDSSIRGYAVDWFFTGLPAYADAERFMCKVREIWNGMRNLPYTDAEICEAIAQFAQLSLVEELDSYTAARHYAEDAIEVEFSRHDGTSARAFCSAADIKACMTETVIATSLAPYQTVSSAEILRACYNPRFMFNFDQFKHLFATRIIPSQLAIARPVVLYNPAQLVTFGLP